MRKSPSWRGSLLIARSFPRFFYNMAEAVVQHEIRGAKEIGNTVNKFNLFFLKDLSIPCQRGNKFNLWRKK
jgi:hypothetical protein